MLKDISNWARYPRSRSTVIPLDSGLSELPLPAGTGSVLPFGMGRSLGDSCLNDGQTLLLTTEMCRVIAFDAASGLLEAEAGLTFDNILGLSVPAGWFLPVTPGTRYVTLGGAIANDVHGKNHHRAGTFGHHVLGFELLRSDGSRRWCSPSENCEWFGATIGGLGLTGLITRVRVQLKPIVNSWMDIETIRFGDLNGFFSLTRESQSRFEYVVAWVDTLSSRGLGSGVFFRGSHNQDQQRSERVPPREAIFSVPPLPFRLLSTGTIRLFNTGFFWLRRHSVRSVSKLAPFFYPLDGIGSYHNIYGPGGMLQWQALVPDAEAASAVLLAARRLGGSFLSVMKVMGDAAPLGIMSFSGTGVTVALDFAYSSGTHRRLRVLDDIVCAAHGRLYPAKDTQMTGSTFRKSYPQWHQFEHYVDPRFSSSFFRRVQREK